MRRKVTWVYRPEIYDRGVKCFGLCHKNGNEWLIEIDPSYCGSPRQVLLTETHEIGHALFPKLRERDIGRKFERLGAELWRLGYRKKER
jgi:hypothetical protein